MKWHDMVFTDHLSPANLGLDSEFTSFAKTADDITTQAAISLTGVWYYSTAKEVYGDDLGIAAIRQSVNRRQPLVDLIILLFLPK